MPIPLIPVVPNHRWLAPPDIKPSGCWQKRSRNAEPKACRGSTEVAVGKSKKRLRMIDDYV